MSQLQIIQENGRLLVDSREVAEMIGKRHDHLLRDIDGYVVVLTKTAAPNFGVSDFFIESTYQDSTNRTLKCYFLTRKGCDMVANKMTGEKGVLFTAAYVTKFEEMERQVVNPYLGLSRELQAIFTIDKKTQEIETRVEKLEDNMTIDYGQQLSLQKVAKNQILTIVGGKETPAYQNKPLRDKLFSSIWSDYKDYFNVGSYRDTALKDCDRAKEYLKQWSPQGKLLREVEEANQQLTFVS
ncbi:ORF6C domain-containing protein [Brevibacillus sp. MER 51]|uniref:ORF6C domain-containing protein n=1 Tax=Brevibacillus sp. MER 51 TaxID=2939560 RepID=UPI00203BE5AA|nr:ORF6C domain-containing protein [Brevibacillus sp. MER 51]MCM3141705.1 ORF6C domain-containing protein [Brevibacillus sp. MER 51]